MWKRLGTPEFNYLDRWRNTFGIERHNVLYWRTHNSVVASCIVTRMSIMLHCVINFLPVSPHSDSKAVPSHIMEENHLSCLYLWPTSFGDYPELVTIDEDWNIDRLLGLADLLHSPVVLSHLCAVANNWCIAAGLGDGARVHLVKVTLSTLHDVTVWPKHINRSVLSGEIGRQTDLFPTSSMRRKTQTIFQLNSLKWYQTCYFTFFQAYAFDLLRLCFLGGGFMHQFFTDKHPVGKKLRKADKLNNRQITKQKAEMTSCFVSFCLWCIKQLFRPHARGQRADHEVVCAHWLCADFNRADYI